MLTILNTVIIEPLKLLFEVVFNTVHSRIDSVGLSIILLSFVLNLLLLPLNKKIEDIQNEQDLIQKKLKPGIEKIKKAFKDDEQYMILSTYYRQNNYKPIFALKSVTSLLLEIPFFIAAYSFLFNLKCIDNKRFLFINNLALPDGLFNGVNALPIIMTLINIVSCVVYTKGQPLKTKIQLYAIAVIFFILLYDAPAGLSLYYLLNNIFSLLKNILIKTKRKKVTKQNDNIYHTHLFLYCCIFLCIVTGVLIPTQAIAASPEEFIDRLYYINPLNYIFNTFLLSLGIYILWLNVYYKLVNNKIKKLMLIIILIICGNSLINHLFFTQNLGIVSYLLKYEALPSFSNNRHIINIITLTIISIVVVFAYKKNSKIVEKIIGIICLAMIVVALFNGTRINDSFQKALARKDFGSSEEASFTLSKEKENVIVFMLDRAISRYFPYLLEEKPILKEQFSGFTYYPNTISFGAYTNIATPALFGGYEYTPEELNKRDNELLVNKHNESLKVLPVLFDLNDFDVTVFDPPYAGYKNIPDLSIYDNYNNIKAYNVEDTKTDMHLEKLNRNLFCYSVARISPTFMFSYLYDLGNYHEEEKLNSVKYPIFIGKYAVLCYLPSFTKVVDSNKGSFVMIQNSSTHEPTELQLPNYDFTSNINNDKFENENIYKKSIYGNELILDSENKIIHYHANMASMLRIGEWLDYLKENDVYDNTRIIIVSDHGRNLYFDDDISLNDRGLSMYRALLLVKDFNCNELTTDSTFMTNADVPYLATKDVISNPINPFTNKEIIQIQKENRKFNIFITDDWDIEINNGYRFIDGTWFSVHDNCLDIDNWKEIEDPSK